MTEMSCKTFIVYPPVNRPELLPHFEALAAAKGWQAFYYAVEQETGESAIVCFFRARREDEAA